MLPNPENLTPEDVRMELMNNSKSAFIAQDFDIPRYNIGFDMLNVGGIFLIIGMLFYNYIEASTLSKNSPDPAKYIYKLHNKGMFRGNILEWLCVILFCFAFFTFFNSIFFYIILISFMVGVLGFAARKLQLSRLINNLS
jgi:hypothetical protein